MDTLKIHGNKLFTKLHGAESEIFENIFYSSELLKHNIFVEKVTILLQRIPEMKRGKYSYYATFHVLRMIWLIIGRMKFEALWVYLVNEYFHTTSLCNVYT